MQIPTSRILSLLEGDFWKAFGNSSNRILSAIQVLTARDIKSNGGLPVKSNLTSRRGNLVRDLQSDANKRKLFTPSKITMEKHVKAPNYYLLTDHRHTITADQKKLFKYFSFRDKDKPMWRRYWGQMGFNPNVKYLYGRGHVEDAIKEVNIEPIIYSEIEKAFPNMTEVIEI